MRVLPEPRKVDVRYIFATRHDLAQAIQAGAFRDDLYFRLAVIRLTIPPLRNRKDDILPIWLHLTQKLSGFREGLPLTDAARDKLLAHHWPGNVRELWNVANYALLVTPFGTCEESAIVFDPAFAALGSAQAAAAPEQPAPPPSDGLVDPRGKTLAQIHAACLTIVMQEQRGNRTNACRQLGIDHKTLLKMLKDYGLEAVGLPGKE